MSDTLLTFTALHTALSLVGLVYGIISLYGMFRHFDGCGGWIRTFVGLAFLATFTGFFFPFNGFTPALGTGGVTMAIFGLMFVAYRMDYHGAWQRVYLLGIVAQVFFLAFVTIVQAFLKIPALQVLAPTQGEPIFGLVQGVNFAVFAVIGACVWWHYRASPMPKQA